MSHQPAPHHRHQSSLEGILDFSAMHQPLEPHQRSAARATLYQIVEHFDHVGSHHQYNRPLLLRYTYDYSLSEESRDQFLRAFFNALELPIEEADPVDLGDAATEERLRGSVVKFADYLLDNFFLPLKASTGKTPQPTPDIHSAVLMTQGSQHLYTGTPTRLSALRGTCLVRDRNRCVVTRAFNIDEAKKRFKTAGAAATDDDGELLHSSPCDPLEVAHIMPHSLMTMDKTPDAEGSSSKRSALAILNMFDIGVAHLITGTDIDRPTNALTLAMYYHKYFGNFEIYFTPVPDSPPNTYRIDTFLPAPLLRDTLPVTRTMFLTESRTIDPPSPRLLAVHRAIAHILHLSAAGEYIDQLLRDLETQVVRADGSTDLGRLVNLQLSVSAH